MTTRLVVGCGTIGSDVVSTLSDWPGDLFVLAGGERRVQRLRDSGVAATQTDLTDSDTLADHAEDVTSVVVAADTPADNRAIATAAREAYPDSFLLAYTGADATATDRTALAAVADTVVDHATVTTDFLLDRVGNDGLELRRLRQALWDTGEPLAIVTHDNPDPDALASAVALQRIADTFGVDAEVCYFGDITHQENRAFVNLLDIDITQLAAGADLSSYGGFALVDHSRPGVNDQLPAETPVDIVIDHHPPRGPVDAGFVDLRSNVGATSTLLVQYLESFDIDIAESVATALLFGIRVDTDDFTREVAVDDFEAAATLVPQADFGTLERVESPSVGTKTFETIARAITNRRRRGSVLTSYVGDLPDRDALAQAADRLLDLESVTATVVYGTNDGVVYISGRARGTELDLGATLRDAFDQIGSAGGHADMAGAQIRVADTTLADAGVAPGESTVNADGDEAPEESADPATEEPEDLETVIAERFFEALDSRPGRVVGGLSLGSRSGDGSAEW